MDAPGEGGGGGESHPFWCDGDVLWLDGSSVCGEGSGALLPVSSQDGGGRGKRETESDEGREGPLSIEVQSHSILPPGSLHTDLVGQNPGPRMQWCISLTRVIGTSQNNE